MKKNLRNTLLIIGIPLLLVIGSIALTGQVNNANTPAYSAVVEKFYDGKIESFSLNLTSGNLEYVEKGNSIKQVYQVPDVSIFYNDIGDILKEQYTATEESATAISYNFTVNKTSWIVSFLPTLLMIGVIGFFWFFMMNRQGGGGGGAGMSIQPTAFIVVKNDDVRMLQISSKPDAADKAISMMPELIDKITALFKKDSKESASAE